MKRVGKKILEFGMIVFGLVLFLFPTIQTMEIKIKSSPYVKEVDETYKKNKKNGTRPETDSFYRQIKAYNKRIYKDGQKDIIDIFSYTRFSSIDLSDFKEDRCGYIKIPAMNVKLPLYVKATNENMTKGATVLGGTSLPIGGKNTNCVIAGHRGYHGAPYFREIERLKPGDKVIIKNSWDKLIYRVESMKIVYPNECDQIKIQKGKDMVTLLTCHPYKGHGRYRYLVYCIRDKEEKVKKKEKEVETMQGIIFKPSEKEIKKDNFIEKAGFLIILFCFLSFTIPKFKQIKVKNTSNYHNNSHQKT